MALGSESNVKLFNLILILDSMGSLRPIYKRVQPLLPGTVWFLCFCLFAIATCEWRPVIHVPWLSPVVGRQYTHVQVNPPPPTKGGGGAGIPEYRSFPGQRVLLTSRPEVWPLKLKSWPLCSSFSLLTKAKLEQFPDNLESFYHKQKPINEQLDFRVGSISAKL